MTEVLPEAPGLGHGAQMSGPPSQPAHGGPTLPPTAHFPPHPGTHHADGGMEQRGREKLHWPKGVWDRLDHAVRKELERTRVASKFLPVERVAPRTQTVAADTITVTSSSAGVVAMATVATGAAPPISVRWNPPSAPPVVSNSYTIDEGAVVRLIELSTDFILTPTQVEHETHVRHDQHGPSHHDEHGAGQPGPGAHGEHGHPGGEHRHHGFSTAVTLATRAANVLAQADDMLMFQGLAAFSTQFYNNFIRWRPSGQPSDYGLLDVVPLLSTGSTVPALPAAQVIPVQLKTAGTPSVYGENTFEAVTAAYATLMGNGQYGPFALTLHNVPYADSFAPLPSTLIMPADRIAPLMTAGFRDSGTLDEPGVTAATLASAAAANPPVGTTAPVAAANAAAVFALSYGATLGVAAATAATAATANGEGNAATAQQDGQNAAFTAASAIPNFPGMPAAANAIQVAKSGLPSYYGSLVSLGGNSMDRVMGVDATVAFMQETPDGNFAFRVFERIALRLKDISAVCRLEFQ